MSFDLLLPVKETLYYMGMKEQNADSELLALIADCEKEVRENIEARFVTDRVPYTAVEGGNITAGTLSFTSKDLAKNHEGCSETVMFAATLGPKIDMLVKRYQIITLTRAVVFNAVAITAIEAYCDSINNQIKKNMEAEGKNCKPRFSPGYGDLSITIQKDFLQALNADKTVGLSLSEGNLMIPEKSVTAFIGVSKI